MNFKPVEIDDYKALKPFFEHQPYRHSNYSLFSVVVWGDQTYRTSFAVDGERVVFLNDSTIIPGGRHLFLPVSPVKRPRLAHLRALAVETGVKQYGFVPESYLMDQDRREAEALFIITEQPEFEDYVYLARDLASLKGNRYAGKRNQIHQFVREYMEKDRAVIEEMKQAHSGECLDFLEKWCEMRDCDADENFSLACEKKAAIRALENIERLEVTGILIRIDGVVSAFGIASRVTEDMGVLNFEKAFPNVRGLYQFLDRECARRLFHGCRYINKESDMGVPNLAQMKKAYHPVMKEKCYRLELRT
jgi:hypothetical protein